MNAMFRIVLLDTDNIQGFIFATNRLKEIRGASALIDALIFQDIPGIIGHYFPHNNLEQIATEQYCIQKDAAFSDFENGQLDCWIISLGAGSARMLVAQNAETSVAKMLAEIEETYREKSGGGLTLTGIQLAQRGGETVMELMNRAETILRARKRNKSLKCQTVSNPFMKPCESAGLEWASELITVPEERFVSLVTTKKADSAVVRKSYFSRFAEYTTKQHLRSQLVTDYNKAQGSARSQYVPDDLTALGETPNAGGYIAVIYADGNRMGWRLQNHFDSCSQLTRFSEQVTQATKSAVFSALSPLLENGLPHFPFEVFLIGGDDILLALPAHLAVPFVLDFAQKFRTETEYETKDGNNTTVSLGTGLIFAHANHPLHELIDKAKTLAKSAKRKSLELFVKSGKSQEVDCIDFLVSKGSGIKTHETILESELQYDDIVLGSQQTITLHKRPYTLADFQQAIETVVDLKRSKFPNSKIKQLFRALYQGWAQGTLECLQIASRLPERARNALFAKFSATLHFPWQQSQPGEYETPLLDWIELYDFVETPNDIN